MSKQLRHADRIHEIISRRGAAASSRLVASWRRSADLHGLDPGGSDGVHRIPERSLFARREATEEMLRIASAKLDSLYELVGSSGCGVFLTDAEGVVLDRRTSDADQSLFDGWGLAPGADWSEAAEGTNGIGTCITEACRVIVHRDQHFRARNTEMSCIDAPVFGPEGELLAALDVSSARADQTAVINKLIAAQVAQIARQIEVGCFRAAFPGARIVVVDDTMPQAAMLAVDADDLVLGATRGARVALGLSASGRLQSIPASDLLGRDEGPAGFRKGERAAMKRALSRAGGNVSEAARALGIGRATLYRRMKRLDQSDNIR